jgi:hypothetical protein
MTKVLSKLCGHAICHAIGCQEVRSQGVIGCQRVVFGHQKGQGVIVWVLGLMCQYGPVEELGHRPRVARPGLRLWTTDIWLDNTHSTFIFIF